MGKRRRSGAVLVRRRAAPLVAVLLASLPAGALVAAGDADEDSGPLIGVWTGPNAERIETVPITRREGARPRAALTLPLPRLERGDRIDLNGEVTVTTTCVERLPRCIGRRYEFDPRIGARIVLAPRPGAAGRGTKRLTRRAELRCGQRRPNRNHHCPLALAGRFRVPDPRRLPCAPERCRLNMVVDAHHPRRRGGEVVLIGADQPDGDVEGGKARLSAAVRRVGGGVSETVRTSARRRARRLEAFGPGEVVLSRRLVGLDRGDLLLVRARQRVRIRQIAYFVRAKLIVADEPDAVRPGGLARRVVARDGTASEANGYNCTVGPSAFRSPCLTRKVGLAALRGAPRRQGEPVPLFVNLVMKSFPKLAQSARGGYPPARVLRGGELEVRRLRAG